MSEGVAAAGCEVAAVLGGQDGRSILVAGSAGGDGAWALPMAVVEGDPALSTLIAALESRFGPLPPLLRATTPREGDGQVPALVLVELDRLERPPGGGARLVDRALLDLDRLEPAELRAPVRRWLDRQASGPTPLDAPWTRHGWFGRASRWMVERMAEVGRPAISPPRAFSAWEISIVLRAPAADGAMYLKCSANVFRSEAAVTARIATRTPDLVTPVVAVDTDEGWLLMDDLGDVALGDLPADAWAPGLEALAAIQRAWVGDTDDLVASGAHVRAIRRLADMVEAMPDWPTARAYLSVDDAAAFRSATPALVAACRRLDDLGLPETVTHGDFHSHNVAVSPTGPRVFDWTDAAVGLPFVDLAPYLIRVEDVEVRRRLRDAYLARWADLLGPAELAEAGDLALIAGALHQVEGYDILVSSLDPADHADMGPATASWMRRSLRFLRDGIEARRQDD